MDEQKIDPRRTNPTPQDNTAGNLRQDDATEAPGVPLVGDHDRGAAGGTAGAGPLQGASTRDRPDVGHDGLAGRVRSATGPDGGDPTGFIGSGRDGGPDDVLTGGSRSGYGGTGPSDPAGNWSGEGAGDDGLQGGDVDRPGRAGEDASKPQLIGGMRSDADVSGPGGPSGSRGGDELGTDGGDRVMTGDAGSGAKADDANTPRSGTLPDEDAEEDSGRARRATPPTG